MFYVEQDLLLLPVVSDEGVEGIAVGHPANQTRVSGQRNHRVSLDAERRNTQTPALEFVVLFTPLKISLAYTQ